MPNYGPSCKGCSGEDCVCCSTYLEERASQRYEAENQEEAREAYEEMQELQGDFDRDDEDDEDGDSNPDAESQAPHDVDTPMAEALEDFGYFGEMGCNED